MTECEAPPSKGCLRHYPNEGGRKAVPTRRRHNYLHTVTLSTTRDFNRVPYNLVEAKSEKYISFESTESKRINRLFWKQIGVSSTKFYLMEFFVENETFLG